jgi:superfamily II DNA or RNA helicase
MSYTLRPHQEKAIELLRNAFKAGYRTPVLQAPTGMGKTLIAIDIIKRMLAAGKSALFIVDRITLIEQTSVEFDKHGIDHGIIQGNHPRSNNCPVQIASVQTLARRTVRHHADIVFCDEAHCMFDSLNKLITHDWNATRFIALSATPWAKGMGKIYDHLIVVETTKSLIEKGFLSDYIAYGPTSIDLAGIKTVAGDYNQKELGERVNTKKIVGDVVSTWLRLGKNRQTVCFAVNVAHSKAIVDEFVANGVTAAHIDAYTDRVEREEVMAAHDSGKIKILSNVGITTKGWDSPNTNCLIYARPTKSLMLHIQILGRVLRKGADNSKAIILDHGNNIERLGFPTDDVPSELCDGTRSKAESEKREKEEKLPKPCPQCFTLKTAFQCPTCGYIPEKMPNVEAEKGELKNLEEARHKRDEHVLWAGMFKQYAIDHGHNLGSAFHRFKDKFGVNPPNCGPKPLTDEFKRYMQHLNIKRAKSKHPSESNNPKAGDYHSTPKKGYDYSLTLTEKGKPMIRVEKNGSFVCWAKQTLVMKRLVGIESDRTGFNKETV